MIKIQPSINQGLEYIRISDLPLSQHREFCSWIPSSRIFEIEYHDKIVNDCVSYGEYEFWLETHSNHHIYQENLLF